MEYAMDAGGITERYVGDANAGDLSVRGGKRSRVDSIVSVSWGRGRLGAGLLRLASQWDGAAKRGARLEQVFLQLKDLAPVRSSLIEWAEDRAIPEPQDTVAAVLCWWLTRICNVCNGTSWIAREGQPKRPCTSCHGKSEAPIPFGNHGRGLVKYMEDAMYSHRQSVRRK